jgi:hypothetical protein
MLLCSSPRRISIWGRPVPLRRGIDGRPAHKAVSCCPAAPAQAPGRRSAPGQVHMCSNRVQMVNTARNEVTAASTACCIDAHLQLMKTGARPLCPRCSLHAPSYGAGLLPAEGCASCCTAATVHWLAQMAPSTHINHIGGPHAMLTEGLLVSSFSTRALDRRDCLPLIAWHDTGSQRHSR